MYNMMGLKFKVKDGERLTGIIVNKLCDDRYIIEFFQDNIPIDIFEVFEETIFSNLTSCKWIVL